MFDAPLPKTAGNFRNVGTGFTNQRHSKQDRRQSPSSHPVGPERRNSDRGRQQTSVRPAASENIRSGESGNPESGTTVSENRYGTQAQRNVYIDGIRTTMRLETEMWDAFDEICDREAMQPSELLDLINEARITGSLSSALRVYIVVYFGTLT